MYTYTYTNKYIYIYIYKHTCNMFQLGLLCLAVLERLGRIVHSSVPGRSGLAMQRASACIERHDSDYSQRREKNEGQCFARYQGISP